MNNTNTNENTTDNIVNILNGIPLKDQMEIIANVMLRIGIQYIELDYSKDLVENLLEDSRKNGENIPNAITMNGLTILTWLNGKMY